MVASLDSSFPWIHGGDWNFVECRQDKQGGMQFSHKEHDMWLGAQDMEWGMGDPWVLKPKCVPKPLVGYTWQNKQEAKPVWQHLDRFYIPVQWMPRVRRVVIREGAFRSTTSL